MKASFAVMVFLTVATFWLLTWRERRAPRNSAAKGVVQGWVARQKATANRWVTAAAIAAGGTTLLMGGLHWLRVWHP